MKKLCISGMEFVASVLNAKNMRLLRAPQLLISVHIPSDPRVPGRREEKFPLGVPNLFTILNGLDGVSLLPLAKGKDRYNEAVSAFLAKRDIAEVIHSNDPNIIILRRKSYEACMEMRTAAAKAVAEFYRLYIRAICSEYGDVLKIGMPFPKCNMSDNHASPVEGDSCIIGPVFVEEGIAKVPILLNGEETTQALYLKPPKF